MEKELNTLRERDRRNGSVDLIEESSRTIVSLEDRVTVLNSLLQDKDSQIEMLKDQHDTEIAANAEREQEWTDEQTAFQVGYHSYFPIPYFYSFFCVL